VRNRSNTHIIAVKIKSRKTDKAFSQAVYIAKYTALSTWSATCWSKSKTWQALSACKYLTSSSGDRKFRIDTVFKIRSKVTESSASCINASIITAAVNISNCAGGAHSCVLIDTSSARESAHYTNRAAIQVKSCEARKTNS